ncbi:splicing factor 3a, subunit 1 [Dermatophagoides farinae]|uniref:Splicing factor 3A subunit 1 n=1 Tax=Dermatophagoides farinae TaxID=6954 RepID=A0A922IA11_DERFA|nr:splicing factor 3a, subunit 1 [Dermatophagoides farinae]
MSGKISIIYPPPEIRNIVDKTASFVARNGPEFETRIQQNEPNNRKFNFLKPGDPYNAYYQFKVKEFRETASNNASENQDIEQQESKQQEDTDTTSLTTESVTNCNQNGQSITKASSVPVSGSVTPKTTDSKKLENIMIQPIIPRGPPPSFEFSDDAPSISAYELDIVKLTAQFVAIHGRSFLNTLMNKESRNYQFDFLRPQHGLFTYFTQLIEQYSKVLMPSKQFLNSLEKEFEDPKLIIEKVRYRTEWTKIIEAEKRKEEEEAEKERIQYAQIDWHDFVIVETVDYQPNESGNFPPPTTPEQVGTRLLMQQRIEANGTETVEMDVDSDEEKNDGKEDKNNEPLPPLPPSLDNVLIRKDYNPKTNKTQPTQAVSTKKLPDNYVISPITGEKIPADKLQEHMRYSLLDPRWVAERDRTIQEKIQQEEVYAAGSAIESSLKHLAERRTDIFGSGDEETLIGRKIGEEEQRKQEKVTWDGHMNSMEATSRAARANISIEEQIQHIHKVKGLLPDDDKDKIGPSMPTTSASTNPNMVVNTVPNMPPPQPIRHPATAGSLLMTPTSTTSMMQPTRSDYGLISGTIPGTLPMYSTHTMPPPIASHLAPQMSAAGIIPPPNIPVQPPPPPPIPSLAESIEPVYKKQRTEDNLIPEQEFLKTCSSSNLTIKVHVPQSSEKTEWKLNGQVINLTLPYTDSLSVVKAKIHELTNLPPGKQKLQAEGIFLKDQNSLAFYNLPNGASILLALKERGGRKK